MELTFNIIFTPGSVRYLRLAILSLLETSPYRYRLVSNNLGSEELILLKDFCKMHSRLDFNAYPTDKILPHGKLLEYLERKNREEFFCFMDFDIIATGPFHEELEIQIKDADIFSSCRPIGINPEDNPKGFTGRCLQSPNSYPLATTFFSIYRSEPLKELIADTGISFEVYRYPEIIPDHVISIIKEMGEEPQLFDTGKLLNMLANHKGLSFKYHEMNELHHIGGIARSFMDMEKGKFESGIRKAYRRFNVSWRRRKQKDWDKLRIKIAQFLAKYLKWLFGDISKQPVWKRTDTPLDERVENMCMLFRDIYREHRRFLNN